MGVKYLTVASLGDGSQADPYRPDLPDGVAFVGQRDSDTGTYLVAVPDVATVPAKAGRTNLTTARARTTAYTAHGLKASDVDRWRVG